MTTGTLRDGVLSGDLYVIGGGDPTLTTTGPHSLDSLAAEIKRRGIDRIAGRRRHRRVALRHRPNPGGWEPWQLEFVGPISAFMVDWNNVRKEPEFMNDPTRANAQLFVDRLAKAKVDVGGGVAVATVSNDATPLFSVDSWPLPKLLNYMLSESDNMMAESFVREIGRRRNGIGVDAGRPRRHRRMRSRHRCVSPTRRHQRRRFGRESLQHALGALLASSARGRARAAVGRAVRVGAGRVRHEPARWHRGSTPRRSSGRVHAKTGTVRGGRALSGYATTIGGRSVVFSIIGNGDDTKLTTKVMDELVETVVDYTG